MRTEELMQNDWVKLKDAPIFCMVCYYTESGDVYGKTAGGGMFVKKADGLCPIELVQDTILCTSFWLKKKGVFCKTVRGVASFTYELPARKLTVTMQWTGITNTHFIAFMHELQQLYRHYTNSELEVDMLHSKRKEYSQRYNHKDREDSHEETEK